MSEALLLDPPVTIASFDAFLGRQRDDLRWELVGGRVVAMTNPTEDHEQIASNIGAPLKLAMNVLGCQDQMRVEHYRKTDEGWPLEVLTASDDKLRFEAVRFEIGLERVYFRVEPTARR